MTDLSNVHGFIVVETASWFYTCGFEEDIDLTNASPPYEIWVKSPEDKKEWEGLLADILDLDKQYNLSPEEREQNAAYRQVFLAAQKALEIAPSEDEKKAFIKAALASMKDVEDMEDMEEVQ